MSTVYIYVYKEIYICMVYIHTVVYLRVCVFLREVVDMYLLKRILVVCVVSSANQSKRQFYNAPPTQRVAVVTVCGCERLIVIVNKTHGEQRRSKSVYVAHKAKQLTVNDIWVGFQRFLLQEVETYKIYDFSTFLSHVLRGWCRSNAFLQLSFLLFNFFIKCVFKVLILTSFRTSSMTGASLQNKHVS